MPVWAFCGVRPSDPNAYQQARSLAVDSGVDVTMGPCLNPNGNFSPTFPGGRYASAQVYMALVELNASVGMKTVVYDERVWNDVPSVRQEAMDSWAPLMQHIAAWDMGDEFAPGTGDWEIFSHRWNNVLTYVTPTTGVGPFTNNLGTVASFEAMVKLPGGNVHYSYDAYDKELSYGLAGLFAPLTNNLMCAVNALDAAFPFTAKSVKEDMIAHRAAGCDMILLFGGATVKDTPMFPNPSVVKDNGRPTLLANAVLQGAK